jgi:hypothetical protein
MLGVRVSKEAIDGSIWRAAAEIAAEAGFDRRKMIRTPAA